MSDIFHEQRRHYDYLDDPEISETALLQAITQILESELSKEDKVALIDEAKAEAIRCGLDAEQVEQIHRESLTGKGMEE